MAACSSSTVAGRVQGSVKSSTKYASCSPSLAVKCTGKSLGRGGCSAGRIAAGGTLARDNRLALGNARQAQAFQIVLAVLVPFERISPAEALDREVRLQAQQFLDIEPGLVALAQMPERRDERPVACDELRIGSGAAPPHDHGAFIVSLEGVGDRVEVLEPRRIRVERRKLAIAFEPLEGDLRLAD